MNRREFLVSSGAVGAMAGLATVSDPACATPAEVQAIMQRITGAAVARPGRVKLDLPPLVENGNSVPIAIKVDSPMTAADHVVAIHVLAKMNPQPYVATFFLGPRAGRASVTTRMRLADTQTVVALCQMSDGTFWFGSADAVVTLASCAEPV